MGGGRLRCLTSSGDLESWSIGSRHEIHHDQTFRRLGNGKVVGKVLPTCVLEPRHPWERRPAAMPRFSRAGGGASANPQHPGRGLSTRAPVGRHPHAAVKSWHVGKGLPTYILEPGHP